MIVLVTDFGTSGPYLGQMKAVLYQKAPTVPVVDLFSDAPAFNPKAAAYLLAAYVNEFPENTVFLCVVDPGVGNPQRRPVIVQVDHRWFVGPDNGLFNVVVMRGKEINWWDITWQPEQLSSSFHGRDLFAPVAAMLARGEPPPGKVQDVDTRIIAGWPQDLFQSIYIDHFGNVMTGLRASNLEPGTILEINGHTLTRAHTFSDVPKGHAFWYENSNGLVELAVNQGHAALELGIRLGDAVQLKS